jgi:hypothetical protein
MGSKIGSMGQHSLTTFQSVGYEGNASDRPVVTALDWSGRYVGQRSHDGAGIAFTLISALEAVDAQRRRHY